MKSIGLGLLMIGCATTATPSSDEDSYSTDLDQPPSLEADPSTSSDVDDVNVLGGFHIIRLFGTNLCIQPRGGSTTQEVLELRICNSALEQNWVIFATQGGFNALNQKSGLCLYNAAPLPLFNGGRPISQEKCIDSNALWGLTATVGFVSFNSRVRTGRDTGFCLNVPNGEARDGGVLDIWACNGGTAQTWFVGQ